MAMSPASSHGGSQPSLAVVSLSALTAALNDGDTVPFDTAISDGDGYFDAVTHKFTVPVGKGGYFLVGLMLDCQTITGTPGFVGISVFNSGADSNINSWAPRSTSNTARPNGSCVLHLADGDSLTPAYSAAVGTGKVNNGASRFWLQKIA